MKKKSNSYKAIKHHLTVAAYLGLGAPASCFAQDVIKIDLIKVTAERTEESLQNVPLAVTAFSEKNIELMEIRNFQDLAFKIPGFSINTLSKSRLNPSLRGGSSSLSSAGAEQAVGLFIDNVYFGSPGDFELDFFDIERIEVLKGPQGTLFGRNTTGGMINVITKTHDGDTRGQVKVSTGNFGLMETRGFFASELGEDMTGSLSYFTLRRDGTSDNSFTGSDSDDRNRFGTRIKFNWQPNADWKLGASLSYSQIDETDAARDVSSSRSTVDLDLLASDFEIDNDTRKVQMFSDGRYESNQLLGTLNISRDMGSMAFESITTFREFDVDQDPYSLAGVPVRLFALSDSREISAISQEFRLVSTNDSALKWQAGTYLLRSDETRFLDTITRWDESTVGGAFAALFGCPDQLESDFNDFIVTPECITNQPELFDDNAFQIDENVVTESYSFYAQGTYEFEHDISLTLGGRYTRDEKTLNGETLGEYDWFWNPAPGTVVTDASDAWSEFTWRAAVDYQATEHVMAYAAASTGFRSGAFDMAQSDPALIDKAVAPETVESIEIGLKSQFFDNRFQLNAAIFNATYTDLQFFVNAVAAGGSAATTNAGEATVDGIELDAIWVITTDLQLSLGYSHQDGSSSGIPADAEIPEGTPPQGAVPNTYFLSIDYSTFVSANGEIYGSLDFLKKDEYSLEFIDNSVDQFRSEVEGLLNGKLGYRSEDGWSVEVWGKNLTNEDIVIYGQDFWFSLYNGQSISENPNLTNASFGPRYSDPRTLGVRFSYTFE